MFLFLPLMLILYSFCYRENKNLIFIFTGIISAVIVCAVKMMFFYPHRIIIFSFVDNFIYFFVKECCLPACILYLLFFIFSKDSLQYKIDAFFPLELSFYMIYLPYVIINSPSGYLNAFSIILKPIIYVLMFASIGVFMREACRLIRNRNKIWLALIYFILIPIFFMGPAAIESLYLMFTKLSLVVISTVIYGAYVVTYVIVKVLKKISSNNSTVAYSLNNIK